MWLCWCKSLPGIPTSVCSFLVAAWSALTVFIMACLRVILWSCTAWEAGAWWIPAVSRTPWSYLSCLSLGFRSFPAGWNISIYKETATQQGTGGWWVWCYLGHKASTRRQLHLLSKALLNKTKQNIHAHWHMPVIPAPRWGGRKSGLQLPPQFESSPSCKDPGSKPTNQQTKRSENNFTLKHSC